MLSTILVALLFQFTVQCVDSHQYIEPTQYPEVCLCTPSTTDISAYVPTVAEIETVFRALNCTVIPPTSTDTVLIHEYGHYGPG